MADDNARTPQAASWARPLKAGVKRSGGIDLSDTPAEAVLKLAENDLAAARACIALIEISQALDSASSFGPFTPLVMLEKMGLRGRLIAVLFQLCGSDARVTLAVLHAARLGVIEPQALGRALTGRGTLDLDTVVAASVAAVPGLATDV